MIIIKEQAETKQPHFQKFEMKRRLEIEYFLNSLRFWYILFCIFFVIAAHGEVQISLIPLKFLLSSCLLYSVYRLLRPLVPSYNRHFLANADYADFVFVGLLIHFTGGTESFFLLSFLFPVLSGLIRFGTNGGLLGLLIMGIILPATSFTAINIHIPFSLHFWANLGNLFFAVGIVAVLVEKEEKLRKTVYTSSITDSLTGLYNAAYLEERVNEELAYCCRGNHSNQTFAIIFIDLNGFKKINDTYGHLIGDKVLIHVAKVLQESTRGGETLARYGGDEFIIFLPQANQKQADKLAQRLNQEMKIHPFMLNENNITPGLSVGAAIYPVHGYDLEELLRIADQQMYEQKQQIKASSQQSS